MANSKSVPKDKTTVSWESPESPNQMPVNPKCLMLK